MSYSTRSSASNNNEVVYTVGNTYREIPSHLAKLDRSGKYRKNHDWVLYLDVLDGNPDLIQRVTFDLGKSFEPRFFSCSCPISVTRHDGQEAWRFYTRQQSYGSVVAKITILGTGGARHEAASHLIVLRRDANQTDGDHYIFTEHSVPKALPTLKMAPDQKFGIELELTSPANMELEQIASQLTTKLRGRFGRITVIREYRDSRHTVDVWKMVPDSSIVCNRTSPNCSTFELVSPVLSGGNGLQQAGQVVDALSNLTPRLEVNKSMGFHVHIDVSGLSLAQIIKVCQNCIKYEDVIDSLVPPSRRTGSPECDRFFQSNRLATHQAGYTSNKARNEALADCASTEELAALMNPNGRYHKVNLQNLVSGRQPTIEFRQHSATSNSRKVNSWVRFCVALVTNAARLASPSALRKDRDLDFQFDALFQYVIKDRALRDYYHNRREELEVEEEIACCSGCASGGSGVCDAHQGGGKRNKSRSGNQVYRIGYAKITPSY